MSNAALIIDLDGTFYDTKEMDDENRLAAAYAISDYKKISISEAKQLLNSEHAERQRSTSSILQSMSIPDYVIEKHQLACIHPENYIKPDIELSKLLRGIRSKFKIVLLTNTRRKIAIKALKAISLKEDDFDLIMAGGDILEAKPSIRTLEQALKGVNGNPIKSFTIGDRWAVDHEPGQDLGMSAIQVNGRNDFVNWLKNRLS